MDIEVMDDDTIRVDQVDGVGSKLELVVEWANDYSWFEIMDVSVVVTDSYLLLLPKGLLNVEFKAEGVIGQIVEYAKQCRDEPSFCETMDSLARFGS